MLRALLVATLLIGGASAHVPTFAEAGGSPESAFVVMDPDQSRVFYDELDAGAQHWFRFERQQGDTIDVSVHLPARETERPTLWIVGPGIAGEGPFQTPPGLGGQQALPTDSLSVEPFTPLAMREIAQWGQSAPETGTFYVVIEAEAATTYSVAIGLGESFTLVEWVGIPAQRVVIMDWASIPWPLALAGELLVAAAALAVAWRRGFSVQQRLGFTAAGAMAGTTGTTLVLAIVAAIQAGVSGALIVPIIFAGIALALGFAAYRAVLGHRAWLGLGLAVGGLFLWAGLIVGPLLLAVWAVWQVGAKKLGDASGQSSPR